MFSRHWISAITAIAYYTAHGLDAKQLSDRNSVCLARLEPAGELGIDRIAVKFAVTEHRVLVVTVTDLLTHRVLVKDGSIAKLN